MAEPNKKQRRLADLPVGPVLAIAPAGCGKTEALAMRAQAAIERGDVVAPRKILAVTFSNKAKANLAARMQSLVGPQWRSRVWVANLHGLAARVIKAHGEQLEIPGDIILPEDRWRRQRRRALGIGWNNQEPFDKALATAKAGLFDDDQVWARLTDADHPEALSYEQALRHEGRLDYDDLIRHAARLLALSEVQALYQQHFALVLVDEVQDLSMMQYGMVSAVGGDRVTYAGDPAQGIYSFAGAEPERVFAEIGAQSPEVVELDLSYRSAPAVLGAVNALASSMGTTQLHCADPRQWTDDGHVIGFEHDDPDAEAASLIAVIADLLADPQAAIGVVFRRAARASALRQQALDAGIFFEDWSLATHLPATVSLVQSWYPQASRVSENDVEQLAELERLCREDVDPADADSLDELASAIDQIEQAIAEELTLAQAIAACRESSDPSAAVAPGLHLLTGHKGKGQEFDWVFILGLEKGQIPDFRNEGPEEIEEELRVLHVMAFRARHGLGFTYCSATFTRSGLRAQEPSPWLPLLQSAATSTQRQ